MEFLAGAKGDLNFDEPVLHKQPEGDEGLAALLNCAEEFVDFAAVQEEFAFTARFMVLQVPEFVFPDVAVKEPDLPFLDTAKRFSDLGVAFADGFDLGTKEGNASLKAIAHKVIVVRLSIADFPITGITGLFFGRHGDRS